MVSLPTALRFLLVPAAVSMLCAAPALAAPAGDEYLPQVPTATGDKPVNETKDIGAPAAGSDALGADENGNAGKDGKDGNDDGSSDDSSTLAAGSGGGDDGDDSGGVLDTLLDPIVLLLIGGVITIAVGLMLARKQNGDSPDPSRARRSSSDAPMPPSGEIIGGSERN